MQKYSNYPKDTNKGMFIESVANVTYMTSLKDVELNGAKMLIYRILKYPHIKYK
jgi:hypothetical protein